MTRRKPRKPTKKPARRSAAIAPAAYRKRSIREVSTLDAGARPLEKPARRAAAAPVAYRKGARAVAVAGMHRAVDAHEAQLAAEDRAAKAATRRNPRPSETVGTGGTAIYNGIVRTGETNAKLIGTTKWRTFDNMMVNCTTVGASCLFYLGLGSSVTWAWTPPDDTPDAAAIAEQWKLVLEGIGKSWRGVIRSFLMGEWRGFALGEMTAYRLADGRTIGVKIADRPQKTIEKWLPGKDGEIETVIQRSPQDGSERALPRWKLLYNVADALSDSPEGVGILRLLVKAVEQILDFEQNEGIGVVTNMGGVPVVYGPLGEIENDPTLTDAEKATKKAPLSEIASKHIRAVDQGYVFDSVTYKDNDGRPSNVKMYGIEILRGDAAAMEPVHAAITRKKHEIASVCGTEFLLVGSDGAGSLALSEAKLQATVQAVNGALDDIVEMINRDFRPFVARANGWDVESCPKASIEKLSMKSALDIATAMRDWYTARAQMPAGDPATNVFRGHLGFPPEPEQSEAEAEADAMLREDLDEPVEPEEEPVEAKKRKRRKAVEDEE